jgi:putative membrane protein
MCVIALLHLLELPTMSDPQRLHPAAIIILALRVSRQLVLPLMAPAVFSLINQGLDALSFGFLLLIGGAMALLVILSAGWGFLYWQRYTFQVIDNELILKQGIIFRKQRSIPRERIQAIDFVEGVMHRIFGLVAVRVQTAGGIGPGFSLIGISRTDADALRAELSLRPSQVREIADAGIAASDETDPDIDAQQPVSPAVTTDEPEPIRRLSLPQLLVAAATSGSIGIALPIVASGVSLLNNMLPNVDLFELGTMLFGGVSWWSIALFVLIAAWVMSFFGTILAHTGFTIRRSDDNLLIERGLLEKRRATVPLNRIQAIRIIDGVLRQPFGYAMVKVESAGYGEEAGESSVLFPMIPRRDVPAFLEAVAPEFAWDTEELEGPPRRAARRYITRMTVIGLVVSAIVVALFYPIGLWALAALPLFGLFGYLCYRDAGWALRNGTMVLRYRTLARSTAIIPKRRIQSSDVTQNILQRRASLGNIQATVASGISGATFTVMHLDKGIADQLFAWTGRDRIRVTGPRMPRQLTPQPVQNVWAGVSPVSPTGNTSSANYPEPDSGEPR